MVTAFPPWHSCLIVLRVIWLKIKPSGFLAWEESVTPESWHMSPALAAVPAGDPGRADSSSRVSLSSTFYPDRRMLLWLRRAEEGNCGAHSSYQNSQPWTGMFLKLLLGLVFHTIRVTPLNPSSPSHPAATSTKGNLEEQFQWNYPWFTLR